MSEKTTPGSIPAATNKNIQMLAEYTSSKMVARFMGIIDTIKLFHWKTTQYALHKATDELHGSLSSKVDDFVEQLMGILSKRIDIDPSTLHVHNCKDLEEFIKHIIGFKLYLEKMQFPTPQYDLFTVRDEMLGSVNKFLYLSSLK
jgi:hypothetical protein